MSCRPDLSRRALTRAPEQIIGAIILPDLATKLACLPLCRSIRPLSKIKD